MSAIVLILSRLCMADRIFLCGRYELLGQKVHESATCKVMFAIDHNSDEIKENEKNQDPPSQAASKVAIKFMRDRAQWQRELSVRQDGLDPRWVVAVQHSFNATGDSTGSLKKFALEAFPYCLVMPRADSSLADVLSHEHLAPSPDEVHWEEVKKIVRQLVEAIQHLHGKRIIHGDIKPLNLMRVRDKWKLIDMDAACAFGSAWGDKSSAAYCPPESVWTSPGGRAHILTPLRQEGAGEGPENESGQPLLASASLDLWSLGALLFMLCTGSSLFNANNDGTLSQAELRKLANWSDAACKRQLGRIRDRYARNLVGRLLRKDPSKRIALEEVEQHPFLTGARQKGRMEGEVAQFEAFVSYRQWCDTLNAKSVTTDLTRRGHLTWCILPCPPLFVCTASRDLFSLFTRWDMIRLESGKNWEEGFCGGLVQSRVFVPIVSASALLSHHNDECRSKGCKSKHRGDTSKLTSASGCDNVILEYRLALELRERGLIEEVVPLLAGPVFDEALVGSDAIVANIETKLKNHLERQGLSEPILPPMSSKETFIKILSGQRVSDLPVVSNLEEALKNCMGRPKFAVFVSCDSTVPHDHAAAQDLIAGLAANGVSATAAAPPTKPHTPSSAATAQHSGQQLKRAVDEDGVRVVAVVVSGASLDKLGEASSSSPASLPSALAVEPLLALELLDRGKLDYLFPVLVAEPSGKKGKFSAFGKGSEQPVTAAVELARKLLGVNKLNRENGSDAAAKSVLSEMFRNQGAFVGGGPSYTIEKAAEDVVGIIQRMQHDSSTLELTQQLRSEKLRLEALLKSEKAKMEKVVAEAVAEKEEAVAEKEKLAQRLEDLERLLPKRSRKDQRLDTSSVVDSLDEFLKI